MARKTYRNLISQDYGITLDVKGSRIHVNFSGGRRFPVVTYGKYTTDNPDIIEALENHHLYGKDWVLDGFIPEKQKPEIKLIEPIQPILESEPVSRILKDVVTTHNARVVLEPKNVQQAKDWLNRNENVPFNKMKNRDEVFSIAKEKNIDFANILKTQ